MGNMADLPCPNDEFGVHDWRHYYGRAPSTPAEHEIGVLPTEQRCGCGARKPWKPVVDETVRLKKVELNEEHRERPADIVDEARAKWRTTKAIYIPGPDGAVCDDPIEVPQVADKDWVDAHALAPVEHLPITECCNARLVTEAPGSGDLTSVCESCRRRNPQVKHAAESPIPGHPHTSDRDAIIALLERLELPTDMNYLVHFQAFVQAQRIYVSRYPTYLDEPIRQMGIKGVLVQARTCVERVWTRTFVSHIRTPMPKLDDAYDGINYLAHFITQSYRQNDGDWNWGE